MLMAIPQPARAVTFTPHRLAGVGRLIPGLVRGFLSNRPDCVVKCEMVDRRQVLEQRRSPVKRLIIATMLAAFTAAIVLPVIAGSDTAVAAEKKKAKKKKPTGKM
jgi:hypothetical protein